MDEQTKERALIKLVAIPLSGTRTLSILRRQFVETPNLVITAEGVDGKTERLRVRLPRDPESAYRNSTKFTTRLTTKSKSGSRVGPAVRQGTGVWPVSSHVETTGQWLSSLKEGAGKMGAAFLRVRGTTFWINEVGETRWSQTACPSLVSELLQ